MIGSNIILIVLIARQFSCRKVMFFSLTVCSHLVLTVLNPDQILGKLLYTRSSEISFHLQHLHIFYLELLSCICVLPQIFHPPSLHWSRAPLWSLGSDRFRRAQRPTGPPDAAARKDVRRLLATSLQQRNRSRKTMVRGQMDDVKNSNHQESSFSLFLPPLDRTSKYTEVPQRFIYKMLHSSNLALKYIWTCNWVTDLTHAVCTIAFNRIYPTVINLNTNILHHVKSMTNKYFKF